MTPRALPNESRQRPDTRAHSAASWVFSDTPHVRHSEASRCQRVFSIFPAISPLAHVFGLPVRLTHITTSTTTTTANQWPRCTPRMTRTRCRLDSLQSVRRKVPPRLLRSTAHCLQKPPLVGPPTKCRPLERRGVSSPGDNALKSAAQTAAISRPSEQIGFGLGLFSCRRACRRRSSAGRPAGYF